MTFTHALGTNNYGPAKFIVDASAANGTHTTIAAALTSASSGDTIFIRPGTYTENLTLKAGVNLTAFGSDASINNTGRVNITGKCTFTAAGTVSISGIELQTNSDFFLAVTGSAASIVNLFNCYLNAVNNTGISYTSSDATSAINISCCNGNLGTTGIGMHSSSSAGTLTYFYTNIQNSGASTTASSNSAGSVSFQYCNFSVPISSTSTGRLLSVYSNYDTSTQNTTPMTVGGSGNGNFQTCSFSTGSASAISSSATTTLNIVDIISSNTNALTGAGTINSYGVVFSGTSHLSNATTQTGGAASGLTQGTAPSAGFIGEQIRGYATGVSLTSTGTFTVTSIALTPGIWDVSGVGHCNWAGAATALQVAISANSASLTGTVIGDSLAQANFNSGVLGQLTLSLPSFRVTLSASATYYLVALSIFTSTASMSGRLSATRVG